MKKYIFGFSLVELLVVIAVLATVIGLSLPNFLGARTRARDARHKAEMSQLKTALQLYYNDYKQFPADTGGPVYNSIRGCGTSGTSACLTTSSPWFAAGGVGGSDSVYMTNAPKDFGTSMFYDQSNGGSDFCLKIALENASDSDITASQSRCSAKCTGLSPSGSDYAVCSE